MEHPDLKETATLSDHSELQFALKLIKRGIDTAAAHRANRPILWAKGLPFYTILSDSKNISLKEFPNGTRQLVSRHINDDGSITDTVIDELTS